MLFIIIPKHQVVFDVDESQPPNILNILFDDKRLYEPTESYILGVSTGRVCTQPVIDLTKLGGGSLDPSPTDERVGIGKRLVPVKAVHSGKIRQIFFKKIFFRRK